jgi:hypothetical protein
MLIGLNVWILFSFNLVYLFVIILFSVFIVLHPHAFSCILGYSMLYFIWLQKHIPWLLINVKRYQMQDFLSQQHNSPFGCMSVIIPTFLPSLENEKPITVTAQSKARTVFARSNAGIMGSNPTRGMDVCVNLFCVCVVLCVGSGLAKGWSPVQGVLSTVYRLRNWKLAKVHKGWRAIDRLDR